MGFFDRNVLVLDVHNEQGSWEAVQIFDATEHALKFFLFAGNHQPFLFGQGGHGAVLGHLVNVGHFLDGFANGRKIGEHSTQPTLGHVGHVKTLCFGFDDFLGLLLGGDEQNLTSGTDDGANRIGGLFEFGLGLVEVNQMDIVLLHEDIRSHLGMPLALEVSKVNACIQHLLLCYLCHGLSSG